MSQDKTEKKHALRHAFGRYATGIAIITTPPALIKRDDRHQREQSLGITVNSFTSVSLDPPLVLWSLIRASERFGGFQKAGAYGVSVLAARHKSLAQYFAAHADVKDAKGAVWESWKTGSPLLSDALARFDCQVERQYDGGDHVIFLGRVLQFDGRTTEDEALTFFRGDYGALSGQKKI